MPIGPTLPPHLAHLVGNRSPSPEAPALPQATAVGPAPNNQAEDDDDDDDDDDDFGPALPPHLLAARQSKVSTSTLASISAVAAGPALPPSIAGPSLSTAGPSYPATGPSRPPANTAGPAYDDDDSDDDVIGPMPVQASENEAGSAVRDFMEREERRRKEAEERNKPQVKKREEWMLVPPTKGVLSHVDPLKRPTTFSRNNAEPTETDNTMWTETPAEKAQRIADEVAGIKRKKDKAGERIMSFDEEQEERRKRKREAEIKDEVARHNSTQRGASLLDQHASKLAKKKKDGKDDDAPPIWDRERDMGITGRLLSDQERSAKIRDARGLGDRFGHGKSGAYQM